MKETSLLVVDGQPPGEDGEGQLVEHLGRRRFRHVVRLPFFPTSRRVWTMIWFCGHLTWYRSTNGVRSLEQRVGRTFYRVATLGELQDYDVDLLVLASCRTFDREFLSKRKARSVVSYDGPLGVDRSLAFAAGFMPRLMREMRRGTWPRPGLRSFFNSATRGDTRWCLSER